jgi:xylulokinase
MDYLMAIDLGSTSIKAMIFDLDGNCAASASQPTEKVTPAGHPDWVIWEPDQIWQGVATACREAVAALDDPSLIRGVAVTGMGMDGVPVDQEGRALYPFISWHDPRTAEQAQWWQEQVGSERTFAITGFPSWAITAVMRILWMKQHQAEIMSRAHKWLLIEDYINCRLSNVMATEPSMASCMLLMDQTKKQWSDELVQAAGLDIDLLPPIRANGSLLGPITASAAAETGIPQGTPVMLGGHDHICGALPLGLLRSGSVLDIIGTWESVQTVVAEPVLTPEIFQSEICMQSHVIPGAYVAWGGAVAGESLEWFKRELGKDAELQGESSAAVWDRLLAGLSDTHPGASGAMFLPHISAAGCPIGDTKSMGAFVGINARTRRDDLLRAVIEGLNYQFLHILEVMQKALGTSFDMVTVTGGVSQNEFWIQNKADMLGVPVTVSDVKDASPLGAALLVGLGLKLYTDADEAFARVQRSGKVYQPQKKLTQQYQQNFALYKQVYPALKPVNHGLFERFRSGA